MTNEKIIATQKDLETAKKVKPLTPSAPLITDKKSRRQTKSTLKVPISAQPGLSPQEHNTQQKIDQQTNTSNLDKQLTQLAESENILFTVSTVFPITLFPDTVIITDEKVTVRHKIFFFSETIRSILIKDVISVEAETDLLFGKLEIVDKYFAQIPMIVSYLKKKDALKAREIIQGLIVTERNQINVREANPDTLKQKLPKIGRTER